MHHLFTKLNSNKKVKLKINDYIIDWDGKSPSKFQWSVKQFLKPYWRSCLCLEEMRIPGSLLRCDFVNISSGLILEASGDQHQKFNPFFHDNSREKYRQSICRDFKKLEWAEANNLKFIEIYETDLPKLSPEYILNKFGIEII